MARRHWLLVFACSAAACGSETLVADHPSAEVDPFIGTGGLGFAVGSISPGPRLPFGMARPGPDTAIRGGAPGFSHCAGYWWEDSDITGFSQLHLIGTGLPDYGVVMIMPATGLTPPVSPADYRARFDHQQERAEVGWYSVDLLPAQIKVELSATTRTAIYRVTYPSSDGQQLVVDLAHGLGTGRTTASELAVDEGQGELFGSVTHLGMMSENYGGFTVWFAMRFDRPFAQVAREGDTLALIDFAPSSDPVRVQIGMSFVSLAAAQANLEAEWLDFDLERAKSAAVAAWDQKLARIAIRGGSDANRQKLYSALYNTYAMPTLFTDADGHYHGVDHMVRRAEGFDYYSDFSTWDTFRTFHPLISLIDPRAQLDFNRSMLAMTEANGLIPKWPLATGEANVMIGYHGETVIADSWQRGVRDFDVERFYAYFKRAALPPELRDQESGRERNCAASYMSLGYCPADLENSSVSKTLENAFSDFVLARLAAALGHADDAATFGARAGSYANLIHPESGMAQPRLADGSFVADFSVEGFSEDFTEGNSRQWTTFVPHDPVGLAAAAGGDTRFVAFLEGLFSGTADVEKTALPDLHYWHGNEPDIHAAYLFTELGHRDRTEHWVDWIREHRYTAGPDGLDGNDDGGTLSSWFVLSALGLYPKLGEPRWILGTPLFEEAAIHLDNGEVLSLKTENWTDGAIHVREIRFDGEVIDGPYLEHDRIAGGGELVFVMQE